jgi:hypothetical protein
MALVAMKHLSTFSLIALVMAAHADSPTPPPERLTSCSSTKSLCVLSDPDTNRTIASPNGANAKPWMIPGWHRWLFVSEDGESVIVGYDGMNLVPPDVTLKQPVLSFYNRGDLKRVITLGDLYNGVSKLQRTTSHYAWTEGIHLNKSNQLVIQLVDGKKAAFAANTGLRQSLIQDGN